ncbi:MAG: hypothetical protein ACLQUY_21060 [Ktedonobacterales bacterium]
MNRVAVWILGSISGIILFFGIFSFSVFGYGATSGCTSYGDNPPPCTPTLQQVVIGNPLAGSPGFSSGLMIVLLAILIGLPAWIGGTILAQRRGSSSRTAILIVSVLASALGIVSLVSVFLTTPALATPETCINSTSPGSPCFYGGPAKLVALLGIGFAPLLASLLIGMPAWVMALTETTRRKQWGWFVAVLLVSPIGAMLYGFLGAQPHPPVIPPAASTLAAL